MIRRARTFLVGDEVVCYVSLITSSYDTSNRDGQNYKNTSVGRGRESTRERELEWERRNDQAGEELLG